MTRKVWYWPLTAAYIESLPGAERDRIRASVEGLATTVPHDALDGATYEVDGSNGVLFAEVSHDDLDHEDFLEVGVHDSHREMALEAARSVPKPPARKLTREEAIAIVEAGIGARPDLPSGADYVDSIRHIWKGLAPGGDSST